jgi:hypothetical protein
MKKHGPDGSLFKYLRVWGEIRKVLKNIESLDDEMYNSIFFEDACFLARMTNNVINCSWSLKRLKSEHDKWNKIVTGVLLDTCELVDLNIAEIFHNFQLHSGFEMLTTNHSLIEEGRSMKHCVGTYSDRVNAGVCAIYRVNGYTLELAVNASGLFIRQMMGFGNSFAPDEDREFVNNKVLDFNEKYKYLGGETRYLMNNELPF